MSVLMAGIDYNRAGIDIRSRFAFTRREIDEALSDLREDERVSGCVLISTCNRTELWIDTNVGDLEAAKLMCSLKQLSYDQYRESLYTLTEKEAVDHLFRLSGGLESKILGEDQIITQVKEALGKARENDSTDQVLEVLFRQAVTAGKRVKSEVSLTTADHSVIHHALVFLNKQGYTVRGKKCLVIGNGMMGKLAAQTLHEAGADVTVTVRQYHSGTVQVPEGCDRIDYEERFSLFRESDLIVSATSSPNLTIQKKHLMPLENDRKIVLIDLAVPRDIEASCGNIPGYSLYDIDSFEADLTNTQLLENIKKAESILNEEKSEFFDYYTGRDMLPMIARIKEETAKDINARLTPVYRRLGQKQDTIALEEEIGAAASRMMNKLLFGLKDKLDRETYRKMLRSMEQVIEE